MRFVNTRVHAAVLAGGRSSRMRTDKRFLKFEGVPLVDRALRLASESVATHQGRVYLCGDVPNRECIPDIQPGLGPAAGVMSAIDAVMSQEIEENSWLLILPVDMPLLTVQVLQRLIGYRECAAVGYHGFEMPFLMSCTFETQKTVHDHCQTDQASQRSIRLLQELLGMQRLPLEVELSGVMANANFLSDWVKINEGVSL